MNSVQKPLRTRSVLFYPSCLGSFWEKRWGKHILNTINSIYEKSWHTGCGQWDNHHHHNNNPVRFPSLALPHEIAFPVKLPIVSSDKTYKYGLYAEHILLNKINSYFERGQAVSTEKTFGEVAFKKISTITLWSQSPCKYSSSWKKIQWILFMKLLHHI